jgi:hypothetical protein
MPRIPGSVNFSSPPMNFLNNPSAGNVYYVMQSANAMYAAFANTHGGLYRDGTAILHTTIQSALDACTANRNDYVIVMADSADYDITATLTMSKARTHLIGAGGNGWGGMQANVCRVHMTTAATDYITVSADTVEISGFFFKQDSTSRGNIVTLSGTRWSPWIHDNFFGMSATASTSNYGIYGAGAVSHAVIERNYFTNYNPGAMTSTDNDIAAFVGLTSASSTRGVIRDNIFKTGMNTAVAAAINCPGEGYIISGNILHQDVAFGGSEAGTLTKGIIGGTNTSLVGNMFTGGVTVNNMVSGGTADATCTWNLAPVDGGVKLDSGGSHAT